MTTNQPQKPSRLEAQIRTFVKFLTILAASIGVLAFIIGAFVQHFTGLAMLMVTSFTVCAVAMVFV